MRKTIHALRLYDHALQWVHAAGYGWEPQWQRTRALAGVTEQDLLRETAWVVLCCGFRETVVREMFDYISLCFCDWEAASEITSRRDACVQTASGRFRNSRKLQALVDVAILVEQTGFNVLHERLMLDPINELQIFPFIGPVTSWHLAKNLGFNVAKNDRHLARLAFDHGYRDAHDLCWTIAAQTGELESVVDIVLWRFATLQSRQLSFRFSYPSGRSAPQKSLGTKVPAVPSNADIR